MKRLLTYTRSAMALFLLPALAATLTHRGADSLYCASSPNVQETNRDECYQAAVQMISQRKYARS
jgi:hypothetical protein